MLRHRDPSHDCQAQVVLPGVCPGVKCGVIASVPTRCTSPSLITFTFLTGGNPLNCLPEAVLRIVGRVLAAPQGVRARRARRDGGAAGPLECRNTAGMIVMAVRVDDQLDVFGLESKLADVAIDHGGGLLETAVEQDVTRLAGDEDRG